MIHPWWHPDIYKQKIPYIQKRAEIFSRIRHFLDGRGYLEVDTPALQHSPCMSAYINGFETKWVGREERFFLHTSPEFAMKKLITAGLPKIYNLAHVFRNEIASKTHSPEFMMLEWYQVGMTYAQMMDETVDLIRYATPDILTTPHMTCDPQAKVQKLTVVEAIKRYADIDISEHLNDLEHLRREAKRIDVYVSEHDDWENALLKILMEKVEPELGKGQISILCDYPISMAALSQPKSDDPRFAERFEMYICGMEMCNAFGELTDADVQQTRFENEIKRRQAFTGETYPMDHAFIDALRHGMPACSGNALGVDRLVMLATGADHIQWVQPTPVSDI